MAHFDHVILPGSEENLLRKELALAFTARGFAVSQVRPEVLHKDGHESSLPALLDKGRSLLCSINGAGLGSLKTTLALLEKAGGKAVLWFVDNPWNVLSSFREPQWRSIPIAVTDHSFIPGLRQHGAACVLHLPLAACQEIMGGPPPVLPGPLAPLVFVGRSAFPGKEGYFEGQSVPPDLLATAVAAMMPASPDDPFPPTENHLATCTPQGPARPDFGWWLRQLGMEDGQTRLWPGKTNRKPAFGAETCSLYWRGSVLDEAARAAKRVFSLPDGVHSLDIFGDTGWLETLPPHSRLHQPVDYYTRLQGIYANARYSLAVTSLQLPAGLNQRHFDVWMAGGVCLSDATPGLGLFPNELVQPIRFDGLDSLQNKLETLEKINRPSLVQDWKTCLLASHTYGHRIERLLRHC